MRADYPVMKAFNAMQDLQKYGDNALLLFALSLRYRLDNIDSIAAQSLTDGADDKKCDLVYVDRDRGIAVIGQGYMAKRPRQSAPARKASYLNTAASWLLSRDIEKLPESLRPAASDLRNALIPQSTDALTSPSVHTLEFWYVHNCPESKNVKEELATVQQTAKNAIRVHFPQSQCRDVRAIEVGLETLEEWYNTVTARILICDALKTKIPGGYHLDSRQWRAFATAVPAKWLYELFKRYGAKLFSANVREYLGSRQSDSNINHGIKESASTQADRFWVYNNGITALVEDYGISADGATLTLKGIAIVNGAQTTGAIGSLAEPPDDTAMVPARFIQCSNVDLIQDIIRYNNSQNRIAAADFRSMDRIQERLRQEFGEFPSVLYLGGRRGGADDVIRRPSNLMSSEVVAQCLAAFHQEPGLAYHRKSRIWEEDAVYGKLFHDKTHASHLIFVYALHQVLCKTRMALGDKEKSNGALTRTEAGTLSFLRSRGSIFLFIAAIGASMESILGKPIPDSFALRFRERLELAEYEAIWAPIVRLCLPFNSELLAPLKDSLVNPEEVKQAIGRFKSLVDSSRASEQLQAEYDKFAAKVSTDPW